MFPQDLSDLWVRSVPERERVRAAEVRADAAADKSDTGEVCCTRTFPARRGDDYIRNPFCN